MEMKRFYLVIDLEEYIIQTLNEFCIPHYVNGAVVFLPEDYTEEDFNVILSIAKMKKRDAMSLAGESEYSPIPNDNSDESFRRDVGPTGVDMGTSNWDYEKYTGKFSTSVDMFPYLKEVLIRDQIPFQIETEKTGFIRDHYFITDMTEEAHKEAVFDALCDMQRDQSDTKIPVYSAKTILDEEKKKRLMNLNGTEEYDILDCDRKKIEKCSSLEELEEFEKKQKNKSLVELLAEINPDYDESELEIYMAEHPEEVIGDSYQRGRFAGIISEKS